MKNPNCFHECTSDCRHNGCNCLCGEWHDQWEGEESLKQKLHRNLNDELEVNKILLDYAFRWWEKVLLWFRKPYYGRDWGGKDYEVVVVAKKMFGKKI